MSLRLNYQTAAPKALQAMFAMQKYVNESSLEARLRHLIVTRVSQINGCAFCLDMHTREALDDGDTIQRLAVLSAWHDTPYFEPHERAALAFAEAVTRIADKGVSDEIYEEVARHFDEKQIVELLITINTINSWNRLSISTGVQPK
jgi:AhpD family alkylhydroperoxidase